MDVEVLDVIGPEIVGDADDRSEEERSAENEEGDLFISVEGHATAPDQLNSISPNNRNSKERFVNSRSLSRLRW